MNPIVIKLGGAAGVDTDAVLNDIATLVAEGWPIVLVHGASAAANTLAERAGVPVRQITSPSGHVSRYTDPETLDLYVAAAAGQMNKQIVATLQHLGCDAVGLSGVDGRLLLARRKDAVRAVENGRQRIIRDDYTGQLTEANGDLLRLLLNRGHTPVIAPLALGTQGERLNVDGDRAAALLAGALEANALVILSNVPGLLAAFPDETSLIRQIEPGGLDAAEDLAQGRMKKKLLAAREALAAGVACVILADSRRAQPIRAALAGEGTVIGHWQPPAAPAASVIIEQEAAHTAGVYPKRPLAIVRGQGARLWDADGRVYIDCVGGQGAANLGHAHPAVTAALATQASRLVACPEIFYNDQRAALLARLAGIAPAGLTRAFLCNSGAEAIEAALKFARLSTGRSEIVAAVRGFHGRTLGALSATWQKEYRQPFEPLLPGFRHVPFNDLAALDAAIHAQTAAVLLEVVQGEGGVHRADPAYLAGAQALCQARGALLIVDEIQTGLGRTGQLFACQHYPDLQPDLLTLAKSLAGGVPMGACLIGPRVQGLRPLLHGSTFGGNPLACAAALATLDTLQRDDLPARAARLGAAMQARLRAINSPLIREVRGVGLLIGLDLRIKVTPVLQALQARGVLALPAGSTVLRLLPPLVISEADLEHVADQIEQALNEISSAR